MPVERISQEGILIADSGAHMSRILASMLRHLGRRDICVAESAEAAWRELERRPFQVVMLDDALAGSKTLDLVSRLRRSDSCANRFTAIIMMASAPDAARIEAARDAGVTEFLRKPFSAAQVGTRLRAIVAAPRPNVLAEAYVGPDRRRKRTGTTDTERRGS